MPNADLSAYPITVAGSYGRWQPLNPALGIDAFGISACVMDPGEEIDITHDEADTGQQEAYVVVTGRAAFQVGDERVEAGPGTVVSAPDPAVVRNFSALEPGTRIVCIGAPPSDEAAKAEFGKWIGAEG